MLPLDNLSSLGFRNLPQVLSLPNFHPPDWGLALDVPRSFNLVTTGAGDLDKLLGAVGGFILRFARCSCSRASFQDRAVRTGDGGHETVKEDRRGKLGRVRAGDLISIMHYNTWPITLQVVYCLRSC